VEGKETPSTILGATVLTSPHLELWYHRRFRYRFSGRLPHHDRVQVQTRQNRSIITFKRGTKQIPKSVPRVNDIEKATITATNSIADFKAHSANVEKALAAAEKMTDAFLWECLNYTVPLGGGEERKLLNGVSSYVVRGKLTALMGESGAGKVRPRFADCVG